MMMVKKPPKPQSVGRDIAYDLEAAVDAMPSHVVFDSNGNRVSDPRIAPEEKSTARNTSKSKENSNRPTNASTNYVVNIDEGENWIVTFRKDKLRAKGWIGTLSEWREAFALLKEDPLALKPPAMSLDAAKKRAQKR